MSLRQLLVFFYCDVLLSFFPGLMGCSSLYLSSYQLLDSWRVIFIFTMTIVVVDLLIKEVLLLFKLERQLARAQNKEAGIQH